MSKLRVPIVGEIRQLPRWARVAFAARCARRVLPLYKRGWPTAPDRHLTAVENAVSVAEDAAAAAFAADAAAAAAAAFAAAAAADADAAAAAFAAARAADAAADAFAAAAADIRRDFDALLQLGQMQKWDDATPVPPSVFGPMWPNGAPDWWPKLEPAPDIAPLIEVYFDDSDFTGEDIALVLEYLSTAYRAEGGQGLRVVEAQTFVPEMAEVPV